MRHVLPGPCLLALALLAGGPGAAAQVPAAAAQSPQERAYGAENRGDYAAAADAFLELVAKEPDVPKWVVSAGDCLGRSGRFSDAIDLLEAGRARFPGVIEVPAMLARTLLLKAERDAGALDRRALQEQAAAIAEDVLRLYPDHEDSRLVLAQARYMLGDWEQAVAQAEEAGRRHPTRPGAHILLGRIATDRLQDLLRAHATGAFSGQALADLVADIDAQRKAAKAAFTRAAELDPTRAHPHVMLARVALIDQKPDDVRRHLLDALAVDPDTVVDHGYITDGLGWERRRELYAECRRRYEQKEGHEPAKVATLRWYEGKALFDGRQWEAARAMFEAALTANPDAVNSHYYAALAAYELGDHDGAEQHAAAYAAASAPAFADVVRSLGGDARGQVAAVVRFLADRAYAGGRIGRSRDLNHVVALVYDTVDAWNNRAFLCRETGQFEAALDAYQRALEKEPRSPQLLNDTAVILHYHLDVEDHLARARELYERAIACADAILADAGASAADKEQARKSRDDARQNLAAMR